MPAPFATNRRLFATLTISSPVMASHTPHQKVSHLLMARLSYWQWLTDSLKWLTSYLSLSYPQPRGTVKLDLLNDFRLHNQSMWYLTGGPNSPLFFGRSSASGWGLLSACPPGFTRSKLNASTKRWKRLSICWCPRAPAHGLMKFCRILIYFLISISFFILFF